MLFYLACNTAVDVHALFGKVALIFGHDVIKVGGMEVEGNIIEDIAELGEGAEREFKEAGIVGLLMDLAFLLEELVIDLEVVFVGQTALVALLGRPGIGEVEVDAVDFVGGKYIGQGSGIGIDEANILNAGSLGLFHGQQDDIGFAFDGDIADIGILQSIANDEIALAAADLQMELSIFILAEEGAPVALMVGGCQHIEGRNLLETSVQILFSAHSHKLYLTISIENI